MQTIKYAFSMLVRGQCLQRYCCCWCCCYCNYYWHSSCAFFLKRYWRLPYSQPHAMLCSGSLQQKSIIEIIFQQENNKYRVVAIIRSATFASDSPAVTLYAVYTAESTVCVKMLFPFLFMYKNCMQYYASQCVYHVVLQCTYGVNCVWSHC